MTLVPQLAPDMSTAKMGERLRVAYEAVMVEDLQRTMKIGRDKVRRQIAALGFGQRGEGAAGDDEGDDMHVGDIVFNYPGETVKEQKLVERSTDAAAVATAVEKVAGSPMGKWGRRLLYAAIGTSLAGNLISVPTAIYAALRAGSTPAVADTDTDTTSEYELRIRPNPLEPGASNAPH